VLFDIVNGFFKSMPYKRCRGFRASARSSRDRVSAEINIRMHQGSLNTSNVPVGDVDSQV